MSIDSGLEKRVRVVFTAEDRGVAQQQQRIEAVRAANAKAEAQSRRDLLRNVERALREEAKSVGVGRERVELGRQINTVVKERVKAERDVLKLIEQSRDAERARADEETAAIRRNARLYATSATERAAAEAQALRLEEQALRVAMAEVKTDAARIRIQTQLNGLTAERLALERQVAEAGAAAATKKNWLAGASDSLGSMVGGLQSLGQSMFWLDALAGAAQRVDAALDAAADATLRNQAIANSAQISIQGASLAMRGQVSEVELQTKANEAYRLGVAKTSADMTQLALAASVLGESIGQTAEDSLESATTALARQSTALLDNLGVSLKVGDAQEAYAKKLGKTVNELTETEKAEAFRVIGLERLVKASKEAARSNSAAALAYKEAKIALLNQTNGLMGYSDRVGLAREALRGLTDSERTAIRTLGIHGQSTNELNEALARYAEEQAKANSEIMGFQVPAKLFKISVREIQELEKERGLDLFGASLEEAEAMKVAAEEARKEQEKLDRAGEIGKETEALEHHLALLEAAGAEQDVTLGIQEQILQSRIEQAQVLGDEAETLKLMNELEIAQVRTSTAKAKRRGGSRVSEADKIRAAGASAVQELEAAGRIAEIMATTANEQIVVEERLREAALARIELERRALEATKARTEVDRQQLATKLEALAQEEQIIEIERRVEARKAEVDLIRQAVAIGSEQTRAESAATARVIDLEGARLRQQEQRVKAEGDLRAASTRNEKQQAQIAEDTAKRLHAIKIAQIQNEARATQRALDLRAQELAAAAPETEIDRIRHLDEVQQLAHDQEMARIEAELALRQEADAEKARLAELEAARLAKALEQVTAWQGTFTSVQGQLTGIAGEWISKRQQVQDADLANYVQGLQSRGQAQSQALDREIEAAKDNAGLRADLERKKAKIEQSVQEQVENAQRRHNERRKREEMNFQGAQLLIQGAVSVAKAASSYPNIPAMVAHAAAAAINFTYGGMLLAGQIPGGGAGASIGAGGGGRDFAGRSQSQTSEAPTTPESVPAADQQPRRPNGGARGPGTGGTVIVINGDINSMGTLDKEALESIGLGIGQAAYGREGAAA